MYLFFLKVFLQVGEVNRQSLAKMFFGKVALEIFRLPIIELHCGVKGRLKLEYGKFKDLLMFECHEISVILTRKLYLRLADVVLLGVERFWHHLAKSKLPCH